MDENQNIIFVLGPTNTGKTHYAIQKMLTYSNGVIGLPLRLLAREVYEKVVKKVGKLKVSLITGEEQISPSTAKYFITTVEAMPTKKSFDFIAVDEIQLCNDFERGHVFTDRLLNQRGKLETLFLGSDSMEMILLSLFPKCAVIKKKRRSNLYFAGKRGLLSLPKRSAIIAFNFNDVYSIASRIKAIKGGSAVVMGSLSPQTRNSQVSMFEEGTVDYIVATDAIGMGLNLDIKNASFSSIKKFDGRENRFLKDAELGQIAGRAGRNILDGSFSTTLNCQNLSYKSIKAIETHNYPATEFLYWRDSNLDFSSLYSLLRSLEKKSNDPRLVKTQNNRDENTLKYLSNLKLVKERLYNKENVKLLWDISTIPDYFKNLDNLFSDLLVKIYCSIVDKGFLNVTWAISETKKLQNLEGSIDMLTFRLAKTRFWNYISNRTHWTENSQELKKLALETERLLSD
ncbi:helicase-related protein, partial [Alphaproteobacteria bacterium]|nr:helicase-related protein [Alphaproteobacteria bacterium]